MFKTVISLLCFIALPAVADQLDEKLSLPDALTVADYVQYQNDSRMQAFVVGYARAISDINFLQFLSVGGSGSPFLCVASTGQSSPEPKPVGAAFVKDAVLQWVNLELQRAEPVQSYIFRKKIRPLAPSAPLQTFVLLAVTNNFRCQ